MSKYFVVRTDEIFVQKGVVAVGWSDVDFTLYNDVNKLSEEVKNNYYLKSTPQYAGRKCGEVRRFKGIAKDDIVLVPCYRGFYIALSTGEFVYDNNSREDDRANQLYVTFVVDEHGNHMIFDRNNKSTALASKLSVQGFAVLEIWEQEIIAIIDDLLVQKKDYSFISKIMSEENKRLIAFKESIKRVLPDYKQIGLEGGGSGFEKLLKSLLEADGYSARVLSKQIGGSSTADADILATKPSKLGEEFASVLFIQAKHYSGKSDAGIDQIISFKEKIENDNINGKAKVITEDGDMPINIEDIKYVLISTGSFTEYVISRAEENNIILIDIDRLAEILFEMIDDIPEILHSLGYVKTYQHINS